MIATTVNKNLEQKLRRALNKNGYILRKSRKPISINNLGEYMVVDAFTNAVVVGARFEYSLDDITDFFDDLFEK